MRNEFIAIATGTSQGIGRAAAERLGNEGAVKTKLTIDEAEGQCGAPQCALQTLPTKENDDV